MKKKWTSSAFWLSVVAALIVVINALAKVFNFKVDEVAITSIATSVIGLLVVIGVLTKDTKKQQKEDEDINIDNTTEPNLDDITEDETKANLDEVTEDETNVKKENGDNNSPNLKSNESSKIKDKEDKAE